MQTLEELIKQTHSLSFQDRKRLLKHLQHLIAEETPAQPSTKKGPYTHSLALAASGVIALVVPLAGLVFAWRARRDKPHRGLQVHAWLVLATLSMLALYLTYAGAIPMLTWR